MVLRFRNGHLSLQPHSGRPSTSRTNENIMQVHELILEDRHRKIDELADMIDVSCSSYQRILSEELRMIRVATKFMPRLIMEDEKQPSSFNTELLKTVAEENLKQTARELAKQFKSHFDLITHS
ncbi:uncharacterized protein LOC115218289 [Octopus sinensis]|uniref:Uncharacterized protein LOC115218289 n=1 Tax=Octopus sinensis TaxID=2607531 RepID=A0A6P7T0F4_9MOLL|nr:uncharacterized protein LOC115218289 [Octopus sinensis]